VTDLQLLATALRPGKVVPIHTEAGDRFDEYFADVETHRDGEWWEV
jgi:ribonuclease J